jgi:hypothetical protein
VRGEERVAGLREFAERRGLDYVEAGELRALTPGLLTGSGGGNELATGELADGLDGTVTHHVFSDGRERRDSTVVVTAVPEIVAFVRALVCRDRSAMGDADLAQLPAERWQRAEFESVEFNRRYRLFTVAGEDTAFLYELFSPALISWLCTEVPSGFGFELNDGNLAVFLPGHLQDPGELDELSALAASLSERIRREAIEELPGSQLFREDEVREDLDRGVSTITWGKPPASVNDAVFAYRQVAARRPRVLGIAVLWGALAAAAGGGLAALVAGPLAIVVAAGFAFGIAFYLARLIGSIRYRFGRAPMQRVALEAFVREYARSRGLALEDRWAFHSEMRGLPMPGIADHVLGGKLPGSEIEGRFVMFGAAPEMRSLGEEIAITADRPLAASGLLVRMAEDLDDDAAERAGLPEHYQLETRGPDALVWRPIQGNLIRTAEGSDAFCRKAGEVVHRLEPGSGAA